MANIPVAALNRLKTEVPRFQKILQSALDRDINEADTVVIITDMLEKVFGLDKYEDLTREFAIQGTYVDLAVRTKNTVDYLIEVKAIGLNLKESHLRQAVDYSAREGVRWVVLTNGIEWEIHRVFVEGQVKAEKILSFNFLELNMRRSEDLEILFMLCKRAMNKDLIEEFYEHRQACNRFTIGALLESDQVVSAVRRLLRSITPGLKASNEEIRNIISTEVVKRDVQSSEQGIEAQKKVKKTLAKLEKIKDKDKARKKSEKINTEESESTEQSPFFAQD